MHDSAGHNGTVQCHHTTESAHNALEHSQVLLQRVRVEGCHYATSPKLRGVNHNIPDAKSMIWPASFFESFDISDDDVRTEATSVESHVTNRSIRGNQQREYIKSLRTVIAYQ